MKAAIKGDTLVVEIPLTEPRPSSTGKTMLVASHNGPTGVLLNGKEIRLNLNATIKP